MLYKMIHFLNPIAILCYPAYRDYFNRTVTLSPNVLSMSLSKKKSASILNRSPETRKEPKVFPLPFAKKKSLFRGDKKRAIAVITMSVAVMHSVFLCTSSLAV